MDYLWSKFQQIRDIFGGEMAEKPPKRAHFMAAASPRNNLKIYNFGTTNAIVMKLITKMYLHKNFCFTKNQGVSHRASESVAKKPLKKSQKIGFLAVFLKIFTTIYKRVLNMIF